MVWEDIFDKKSSISMEFVKSLRSGLWRSKVGMQIKQRKKDGPDIHSPAKIISGLAKSTIKTYEIRYFSKTFFAHFFVDNC